MSIPVISSHTVLDVINRFLLYVVDRTPVNTWWLFNCVFQQLKYFEIETFKFE